ncbi:MAG: threonine/serine exporter family protein [Flavisolibacter sp.]
MDWFILIEKCVWFGMAALGFAVLFNVPPRTLVNVFLIAATGCFFRLLFMGFNVNIILATFLGACLIGLLCIFGAHKNATAPFVLSIPSVIPMVPGVYIYRLILGFVRIAEYSTGNYPPRLLADTVNYGLKSLFILMAIAMGVAFPMMISRKETAKNFFALKQGRGV